MQLCQRVGRACLVLILGFWAYSTIASDAPAPATKSIPSHPALVYSTILPDANDKVTAVAVGRDGSLYLAGTNVAGESAMIGPKAQANLGRPFVARLSADGSSVVFRVYLDSEWLSEARAIAVDLQGNAYVAGRTRARDFPVLNAVQQSCTSDGRGECAGNAFLVKVNPNGKLLYSTYLGGSGEDEANTVAVDGAGNAYVAGLARSADFPLVNPVQMVAEGDGDAFITKISPDGSRILFSSYLGGSERDEIRGIAVDPAGDIYVTGETKSSDFPTQSALQNACGTPQTGCIGKAFVTRLSATGNIVFSTYLGGSGGDVGSSIAFDATGIYVAGSTRSKDFPAIKPLQRTLSGQSDSFLTKFLPDGSAIVFSTYLGGHGEDYAKSLALDHSGKAAIVGWTRSPDFPIQSALQERCSGTSEKCSADAFISVVDTKNRILLFSTYLGGSGTDVGESVAVDEQGSVYVGGWTHSHDFPEAQISTSHRANLQGAFAAKIGSFIALPGDVTCGTRSNNWTGSGGDNQWTTSANWSLSRVPVSSDQVCIASTFTNRITISSLASANQQIAALTSGAPLTFSGGPLTIPGGTFAADLTVSSGVLTFTEFGTMTTLEMNGGTMTGVGTITTNGALTWAGGAICTSYSSQNQSCNASQGVSAVFANAGVSITGPVTLDSRKLNNAQSASITGAFNMTLADGAIINNQSGAQWILASDANLQNAGGSKSPVFINAGTFKKNGGTGTTTVQVFFNNTGVVQLNAANLDLTGGESCTGACSGSWSVASGTTLQFDNGNYTLSGQIGGTGAAGAGSVDFATAGATLTGNYNISGGTTIGAGTVNFSGTVSNLGALSVNGGIADLATTAVSTITIPTLSLNGGTLAANDNLTVTGMLTWSDGNMCTTYSSTLASCVAPTTEAVTNANGGITFGSGFPTLDGRTLNNAQTARMPVAGHSSLTLLDGSIINNSAGATWNLTADVNINGISGVFNNNGTFEKTGGITTSSIQPVFNNTGNVTESSGILDLTGGGSCSGTCSGSWTTSSGGTLQFDTANFSLSGPFSGAGMVSFSSGSAVLTGAYTVSGTTNFGGALVSFNQPGTVTFTGPANLTGGAIYGTATLTFAAMLTWTYGEMCTFYSQLTAGCAMPQTQSVTNANGGITFPFGFPTLDGRTLNNNQVMSMMGSGYFLTMLDSAVIYNKAGATWNLAADTNISGTTGILVNLGTFEKTAGTGVSTIQPAFHNVGAVLANAATLDFMGGGSCNATCAGSWTVASGATLQFDSSTYALSGKLTGAGTINFTSGSEVLTGSYSLTGTTNFSGSAVGFNQSGTVTFGGPVNLAAGFVYGVAILNLNAMLTWTNGTMCTAYSTTTGACSAPQTQAVTNAKGGITFGAGLPVLDGRTLNNLQTAILTQRGSYLTLLDASVVNNSSTGTWNFSVDASLKGSSGFFNNGGLFEKTSGTGTSSVQPAFKNAGTVQSATGTMSFSGTYGQQNGSTNASTGLLSFSSTPTLTGGVLSGSGIIQGSVQNTSGTIAPGTSQAVGAVTLSGNCTQGTAASFTVKIGGTNTSQYDRLLLGGTGTVAGALNVTTINGFSPSAGQTFTIIQSKGVSGQFSSVTNGWKVTYNRTSVVLTFQ